MSNPAIGKLMLGLKFAPALIPYTPTRLNADLDTGVASILAGVGSDYRMWVDAAGSKIQLGHKDLVYGGYSAVADALNTRLPGLAITAAGIAMGFNDVDGAWRNAIALDATTGNATFSGTVNATSGNFSEGITIGSTGVTLGELGAGSYTTATLEADLAAGVGDILAGSGSDYQMWVDSVGAKIEFGHKDLDMAGIGAGYAGALRTGLLVSASGIAAGYNRQSDGAWVNALAIGSSGDVTIAGTLKAGSVIEVGATVDGVPIGDVALDAAAAVAAVDEMASDNQLTPLEKRQLRMEWDAIIGGLGDLRDQAALFSVSVTAHNSALGAYAKYLNGGVTWTESGLPAWINDAGIGTTTAISGATLRANSKSYYTQRSLLINAVAAKAKVLADAAQADADTALASAASAEADAASALAAVGSKLSASSSYVLAGLVNVAAASTAGFKLGTITWNAAGGVTSGSGVAITANGFVGAKAGVVTFSIDNTGAATFKGDISTTGDAKFLGRSTGTSSVFVDGVTKNIDYSAWADASTNPSSAAYVRAGSVGVATAPSAAANVGVVGKGSTVGSTLGYGVVGDGGFVGGYFVSGSSATGAAGLKCYNSAGGIALDVVGGMKVSTSTLVANLNAQYLGDGANKLAVSGALSVGAATATFLSNNKPGSASSNTWLKVLFNGVAYYIPAWT